MYGLIRRPEAAAQLLKDEIVPIVGSLPPPGAGADSPDLATLSSALHSRTKTLDVIVGCTENTADYPTHYAQVLALFRALAATSNAAGVRPLVLWSSGSKDYGFSPVEGTPGLAPHTEDSPLEAPDFVIPRATHALKILEPDNATLFDAVVLRPPNVYGYSSSYYGMIFEWAARARAEAEAEGGSAGYEVAVDPRTILSAFHVDDCGEAYVALAELADRSRIAGRVLNVGGRGYMTTGQLLDALAREYEIPGGFRYTDSEKARRHVAGAVGSAIAWSQWLGSDEIRRITGWTDRRMPFVENLGVYRRAYECAVAAGHDDVARVQEMRKVFDRFWKE